MHRSIKEKERLIGWFLLFQKTKKPTRKYMQEAMTARRK
jgi:hypothetical protein